MCSQFEQLNRDPVLRSDTGPAANAALLARVMVLCTHRYAQPDWVRLGGDTRATVGVPGWVLDPAAEPGRPEVVQYGRLRFTDPGQIDAITRHWDSLHQWVIQHQGCAAVRQTLPAAATLAPGARERAR